MTTYRADLHIHTCLSPCAELEMTPRNIVSAARDAGLGIIGICDHNSCENVPYVKKSAAMMDISVIGGIEEIHLLALFDDDANLFSLQKIIYDHLNGENDERVFGDQVVTNERDEVVAFNRRLLIGATDLSLEDIIDAIHALNGLAVASHVDRESFSVVSQLGYIPDGLRIDAIEVSGREKLESFAGSPFPRVAFSDAHRLDRIGMNYTEFVMAGPSCTDIRESLRGDSYKSVYA